MTQGRADILNRDALVDACTWKAYREPYTLYLQRYDETSPYHKHQPMSKERMKLMGRLRSILKPI